MLTFTAKKEMTLSGYGKLPSGDRLKRIRNSPNYKNGAFQNLTKTNAMAEDASVLKTMREFLHKPDNVIPPAVLPSVKTDLRSLPQHDCLVWFGHSSYLLKLDGKIIVVDPVLSGNAAPLKFMIKAFKGADAFTADDLPEIDILLLTHDHYDHLDHRVMLKLIKKTKNVVCSLGVGSHLERWGFSSGVIHELDWFERFSNGDLRITAAPARHFSGRGLKRGQTFWSSFVLTSKRLSIFAGGDSGYDTHFKKIGDEFGPFDLAILESGQYNKAWPKIHMMPEETVQASLDLKAAVMMPVHWGKFSLSMHAWDEPVERVMKEAEKKNVVVATPVIGEVFEIGGKIPEKRWWREVMKGSK
jgi:L-ascorbate metabolism protein UlaG (beta-lactamase superfamily)